MSLQLLDKLLFPGKHGLLIYFRLLKVARATTRYLDQDHPLQRHVTTVVERLGGEAVAHVGIDGCGAPAHTQPDRPRPRLRRGHRAGRRADGGGRVTR